MHYTSLEFVSEVIDAWQTEIIWSEDVYSRERYGNVITFYCITGGTRIIFASNGITIISPKGYIESFTQGYMQRG